MKKNAIYLNSDLVKIHEKNAIDSSIQQITK